MARDFDGSVDYLEVSSAILAGEPASAFARVIPDTLPGSMSIFGLDFTGGTGGKNYFNIQLLATGAARCIVHDDTNAIANTVSTTTAGVQAAVGGTWTKSGGTTNVACWLNGASKATGTDTLNAPTFNNTSIGVLDFTVSGLIQFFDGKIAEVCLWNVELTDGEMESLGSTPISPLFIRPQSIVSYWPIIGRTSPEIDIVGGNNMTVVSAPPVATHPPIIYPATAAIVAVPAAAAGFIPYPNPRYTLTGGMQAMAGGI